jgi:tryptophan synthase alpha chain
VETVLLTAPVTPDDRLKVICQRSRGFVYGVGLMGVTGQRTTVAASSLTMAKRLKAVTDKPVIIGFGVSTPDQARALCQEADGVVVASALMRGMLDGDSPEALGDQVVAMRSALDAG